MYPNAIQQPNYTDDDYLKVDEVAEALKMSKATLDAWRSKKLGPRFKKLGKRMVRYKWADVRQWMEGQGNNK
jgi:predicted DNA-binding transcriptional regulator AlpA